MSFFGSGISLLSPTNGSLMSIGLSLGIVCVASCYVWFLDFDFIEEGAEAWPTKIYGMVRSFFFNGDAHLAVFRNFEAAIKNKE